MDFLTFKEFISIPVLIAFYYSGAVVFPFFMWFFSAWLIKKYKLIGAVHTKGKEMVWRALSTKQKFMLTSAFLLVLLFMELFWRMLFEYLIAFMQMRDALLQ
ncbi:MAG: DUF4282 domain-containing protein [Cocleimonas sp.]|nr:DUF4282 domain-containing protein [Cocleimonas sp.]